MTSMYGDDLPLAEILRKRLQKRLEAISEAPDLHYESMAPTGAENTDTDLNEGARLGTSGRFHTFMENSAGEDVFVFQNSLPDDGEDQKFEALTEVIGAIANFMVQQGDPANKNDLDNSEVPAGYTYLFQLAAHDLIFSSAGDIETEEDDIPVLNSRRTGLGLETIFGGGPIHCPFAFEGASANGIGETAKTSSKRLRIGRVLSNGEYPPAKRDLERASYSFPKEKAPQNGGSDYAYLADIRNDDNFILSQMTVLFHEFFNIVLTRLKRNQDKLGKSTQSLAMAVTRQIYREIIKEDLLPKILDPAVVDYYTKDGGEYFDRPEGGFSVPREFAFAAVRVGHSMVRPGYRLQHEETVSLQQLVKASSSRRPTENTPEKWGIDWSLFFDIDGSADKPEINFARKFDFFEAVDFTHFSVVTPPGDGAWRLPGACGRDLARGATEGVLSVPVIVERIRAVNPDLLKTEKGDLGGDHIASVVKDAINAKKDFALSNYSQLPITNGPGISGADPLAVAQEDPPLLFFLLAEASEADGEKLGRLGSILIADVFYRWLQTPQGGGASQRWREEVDAAVSTVFGKRPPPASMAALIKFVSAYQHEWSVPENPDGGNLT